MPDDVDSGLTPRPSRPRHRIAILLGAVLFMVGIAVFGIRLHHPGPYVMPGGGNLLSGVLAMLIGGLLAVYGVRRPRGAAALVWLGILGAPVILFFSLYATLAELEEVISIKAVDRAGKPANLRLWVVDVDGRPWVTMPGWKSDKHALEEEPVIMLRNGAETCVRATRIDDRDTVNAMHRRRHEKYAIQRLATVVGLFAETASDETVTLRLDPCQSGN